MAITVTYHPSWQQRQRPPRQPVSQAPPNVGPILSLLLTLAMLAMLVVLSAGGSLAVASMAALAPAGLALMVASGQLVMEVVQWLEKSKKNNRLA